MTTLKTCSCNQNGLSKNAPPCQFVEITDKLPECPCSCIPSINTGPPCPFKSSAPCMPSPVQCILQNDQAQGRFEGCPLAKNVGDTQPSSNQQQLCVFSEPKPINFKEWPPYRCTCVPGTCPEIVKNLIRSWGFDPMCYCPCPKEAAATSADGADGTTADRSKISQKSGDSKTKSTTGLSDMKSASRTSASNVNIANSKLNMSLGGNATVGAGNSPTTPDGLNPASDEAGDDDSTAPPGGKLITRGKGFKIYEIDGEKILFNYSTKNCKWMKCECSKKEINSCGCNEWKRLTKYRNCVCPGAKKMRPIQVKPVVKDLRPPQPEHSAGSTEERKSVKYK
ncbi:hypothetical protein GE061_005525 [Apolygus lucorum]|uniref:Uncharacterized protein n=1 Tax=Apolygus lucorum TaxID=248454 RepID=A0A8S9WY99_APOLU|nr:hypothetical protein GE061_005525 [Apolygus lucorum]